MAFTPGKWIKTNIKSIGKDIRKNANSAWSDLKEGDFGEFLDPFDFLDKAKLDPRSIKDKVNSFKNLADGFKPVELPELPEFNPNNMDFVYSQEPQLPESTLSKLINNPNAKKAAIALVILLIVLAIMPEIRKLIAKNAA